MTLQNSPRRIREIEMALQEHMSLFAYDLIDTPVIADADIFLTRAGYTIIEQLFTFERSGRLMALRPEFTAVVAHRYIQEKHTEPVRWQLSGSIFSDEASDYSSQYEQHNIGAELINQDGIMAETEIVAMATQGMNKLGISDWQLIIGHVGLQLHLLSQFGLDNRTYRILLTQRDKLKEEGKQAVLDYLNEILPVDDSVVLQESGNGQETQQMLDVLLDSTPYGNTMGGRSRHDIAARLLKKHDRGLERSQIEAALDFLEKWGNIRGKASEIGSEIQAFIANDDEYGQQLFDEWYQMIKLLKTYGISDEQIIIQPDLTKNWDYYTGIVFGIHANDNYVASGGRYDGLTRLLGGEDIIPAVGFAYYTETLLQTLPPSKSESAIMTLSSNNPKETIQWASILREAGLAIKIVNDNATIIIDGDNAGYNDKTYSRDELIQELSQ